MVLNNLRQSKLLTSLASPTLPMVSLLSVASSANAFLHFDYSVGNSSMFPQFQPLPKACPRHES